MAEGKKMDLGQTVKQIMDLLEPELAAEGFELLDVRVFQGGGRMQVRVYVDSLDAGDDAGINMGQVSSASRTTNMLLEEADLFLGNYIVEVSSPGIRRPLRKQAHFEAAIGKKVEILMRGKKPVRRVKGVLQTVAFGKITVAPGDGSPVAEDASVETIELEIKGIYEANLDLYFDAQALINEDRRKRKEDKRKARQEKPGKRRGRPKAPKDQKTESPADGGADES